MRGSVLRNCRRRATTRGLPRGNSLIGRWPRPCFGSIGCALRLLRRVRTARARGARRRRRRCALCLRGPGLRGRRMRRSLRCLRPGHPRFLRSLCGKGLPHYRIPRLVAVVSAMKHVLLLGLRISIPRVLSLVYGQRSGPRRARRDSTGPSRPDVVPTWHPSAHPSAVPRLHATRRSTAGADDDRARAHAGCTPARTPAPRAPTGRCTTSSRTSCPLRRPNTYRRRRNSSRQDAAHSRRGSRGSGQATGTWAR